MQHEELSIENFLKLSQSCPILDVRSPGEYLHAHIPNAISFPLFTDEERKIVGTAYKQESKEKAIKIGLGFFGPKMVQMVETAEALCSAQQTGEAGSNKKTVLVHCWRGGMRSAGVAWLLQLYGFKVCTLKGGYKMFRRWVLSAFEKPYPFKVVGGYTGSGKTELLKALQQQGESTIDLEALAAHKGSAFGSLGAPKQPSQEMFENKLALALNQFSGEKECLWIEDESRRIGDLNIPGSLYKCKQTMPVYFLDIPFEQRLQYIIHGYGKYDKTALADAVLRIKKRLGPNETHAAIKCLLEDDIENGFAILLKYYDKQYAKSITLQVKPTPCVITNINAPVIDAITNAGLILQAFKNERTYEHSEH